MQTNEEQHMFLSPFTTAYWSQSLKEMKSIKTLAVVSLLIALQLVISSFYIPLPLYGTQRIYFTFIIVAIIAMLYGPVVSLWTALISDLLGFILHPQGVFFIGYTLTALLTALIFSLYLYRTRLTIFKLFLCKLTINMLINVCLNSLWDSIIIGKGYLPLMIARIPKNLIMLPFELFMLCILLRMLMPILKREQLLCYSPFDKKLKWF